MKMGQKKPGTAGFAKLISYELVVCINGDLHNEVKMLREELEKKYMVGSGNNDRICISIASFYAKEMMEDLLIRWMHRICSAEKVCELHFNNYGAYPQKGLFLRVQDFGLFGRLAQQLKIIDDYLQSNDCPATVFITKPQLCIASELPDDVYEKAVPEYSSRSFAATYTVKEFSLVKSHGVECECKTITNFHLSPARERA